MYRKRREIDNSGGQRTARGDRPARRRSAIGDRVARLIGQFYGSQRAAARAWGTTRGTLDRILKGEVDAPRADLLVRMARACGADVDWLLTGEGPAPQPPHEPRPSPAQQRWGELVESLELEPDTRDALLLLPGRVRRGFSQMFVWYPLTQHDQTPFKNHELTARRRAEDLETQAWIEFLNLLLGRYGREESRKILERNRHLIAIGFSSASYLLLFHYLAREPQFDQARVLRGLTQAVKQQAMAFHPRDVGEISELDVAAAIDPFGPPAPDLQAAPSAVDTSPRTTPPA